MHRPDRGQIAAAMEGLRGGKFLISPVEDGFPLPPEPVPRCSRREAERLPYGLSAAQNFGSLHAATLWSG